MPWFCDGDDDHFLRAGRGGVKYLGSGRSVDRVVTDMKIDSGFRRCRLYWTLVEALMRKIMRSQGMFIVSCNQSCQLPSGWLTLRHHENIIPR